MLFYVQGDRPALSMYKPNRCAAPRQLLTERCVKPYLHLILFTGEDNPLVLRGQSALLLYSFFMKFMKLPEGGFHYSYQD